MGAKMAQDGTALRDSPQSDMNLGTASPSAPALRTLTRLALAGRTYRPEEIAQADGSKATVARVQNMDPLQWLISRSRDPLQPHQAEAARRAQKDFARARSSSVKVAGASAQALYRTADAMNAAKEWTGRSTGSAQPRSFTVSDHRLDAIRRLGQMMEHVGAVSFHLLSRVLGDDVGLTALSEELGEDQKYVSRRLREALDQAASFYSIAPKGYASHPGRDDRQIVQAMNSTKAGRVSGREHGK